MTSVEHNPPLQEIVEAQLTPIFMDLCKNSDLPTKARTDILWTITNILSGSHEMS